MKKTIGYIGAYSLYYIGDLACKISYKIDSYWLAMLYQWSMSKSANIQDWAKLNKPWKKVNNV